ncbi:hypothetical protein CsSME_00044708 [Camellia sinensis var. sinensis]
MSTEIQMWVDRSWEVSWVKDIRAQQSLQAIDILVGGGDKMGLSSGWVLESGSRMVVSPWMLLQVEGRDTGSLVVGFRLVIAPLG